MWREAPASCTTPCRGGCSMARRFGGRHSPDSALPAPLWHLAAVAILAVSHPLADILIRGPEFFVAHRFGASETVWLGVALFVAIPACVSRAAGRHALIGLIG